MWRSVLPFFEPSQRLREHLELFESCQCNPRPRSASVKGASSVAFSSAAAGDTLSTVPTFRDSLKPISTGMA